MTYILVSRSIRIRRSANPCKYFAPDVANSPRFIRYPPCWGVPSGSRPSDVQLARAALSSFSQGGPRRGGREAHTRCPYMQHQYLNRGYDYGRKTVAVCDLLLYISLSMVHDSCAMDCCSLRDRLCACAGVRGCLKGERLQKMQFIDCCIQYEV